MTIDAAQVAKHSSANVEHYTPRDIVDRARFVMGGIDLDPASCERANTALIRAERFFTRDDDGLRQSWYGRVWLNPPGGKRDHKSYAKLFWQKLVEEWLARRVTEACFLGFNMEILQTTQIGGGLPCMLFPFCIPSRRIAFMYVDGDDDSDLKVGGGPTHANVLVYLPPHASLGHPNVGLHFREHFTSLGCVKDTYGGAQFGTDATYVSVPRQAALF